MTDQAYTFLSSHIVKEIAVLGGNISDFVPEDVERELKKYAADFAKRNCARQ